MAFSLLSPPHPPLSNYTTTAIVATPLTPSFSLISSLSTPRLFNKHHPYASSLTSSFHFHSNLLSSSSFFPSMSRGNDAVPMTSSSSASSSSFNGGSEEFVADEIETTTTEDDEDDDDGVVVVPETEEDISYALPERWDVLGLGQAMVLLLLFLTLSFIFFPYSTPV